MKKIVYPNYKTKCGWNALLPEYQNKSTLSHDINSDVVIIGSGYTGLAAAKRWFELAPDDAITMIDASSCGEGSSGRNSGFLIEIALANDAKSTSLKRLIKCNKLISRTINKIKQVASTATLDCEMHRTGTYRVAAGDIGLKSLLKYQRFLEASKLEHKILNTEQLNELIGTNYYRQGLYTPHCYLAQPAALIRSLTEQLPPSIQCYENTPALECLKNKSHWIIKTPQAEIKTKKVIVANNAFCGKLGIGNHRVATIYTYAALTEKLDEETLSLLGTDNNWGILPTHRLGSTLRRTIDGRLMIRSLYNYDKEEKIESVTKKLRYHLKMRYPNLPELNFHSVWGGATGLTLNGAPLWGQIDKNLFISAGCNGGGVVKGTLFGELLSDLANNQPTPNIQQFFGQASWMPLDPFREIGFNLVSMIERNRAKAEI
jgi:glycine/D-amino acid oxidase-like deaminating enzyme